MVKGSILLSIFLLCLSWLKNMEKNSLVIVYTGKGKGKTTAALGMALRAVGHKQKICLIQFIKGSWHYGELDSLERLAPELDLIVTGKGFVGIIDDKSPKEEHKKVANEAILLSKEKIESGKYDLVILDEVNYAVNLGLVDIKQVIDLIKSRPQNVNIVLTGNHAMPELIEIADLVTEMKEIKHPFQSGIKAKKGIDF